VKGERSFRMQSCVLSVSLPGKEGVEGGPRNG
jgi:hypothetical protein